MKNSKSRKINNRQPRRKMGLLALGAVVLIGASFSVASGTIIESGNSIVAAVVTAISGKPTVLIGRSGDSPRGSIRMGVTSALAVYDVSAKNVTHGATIKYVTFFADT